jgi:hypothetical protein
MPTFDNCEFIQNTGDSGGGLYIQTTGITITNCFFQGNSATQSGAGRGGALTSEEFFSKQRLHWDMSSCPKCDRYKFH